jgi:hypothetical protein
MDRRTALAALMSAAAVTRLSGQSDSTALILAHANSGDPLPPGEYYFQPPLVLHDLPGLRGTPGQTILRPLSATSPSQILIDVQTTQPGDISGLPRRSVFEDLRIISNGNGYGIMADGAMLRFHRVDLINCYHGLTFAWGVDIDIADCILRHNTANVYIPAATGGRTTTTIRFRESQIREALYAGIVIDAGIGISLENTIVESNTSFGLYVGSNARSVLCENVWFENNGTDVYPPNATNITLSHIPQH